MGKSVAELRIEHRDDPSALAAFLRRRWHADYIVSRGRILRAEVLKAFAAMDGSELAGMLTYHIESDQCEIVTLDALRENTGAGSALIAHAARFAKEQGCARLWLITTNDNAHAIRFYQKRGMDMVAVHRHAMDEARRLKPEIPPLGNDGIPMRHEVEFELLL